MSAADIGSLRLWGVEASPYLLKIEAMLRYRQLEFKRLPRDGGRAENWRAFLQLQQAKRLRKISRYPAMSKLDEYPGVPYMQINQREWLYDSSAIGCWLDEQLPDAARPLLPSDPAMAFIARLIDEAFDEFGLYMVHHQRWVPSAADTAMAEVSAKELAAWLPRPLAAVMRWQLPRRQTRRCPYLFSVAPSADRASGGPAGKPPVRVAPARAGFPATHSLLQQCWQNYLAAMEHLLTQQPYLLGQQFTLADASAYGQLGMNLIDPTTIAELQRLAPTTYRWLLAIAAGEHARQQGPLQISPALQPLLDCIQTTFVPLMQQNTAAYLQAQQQGVTQFNEAAFDKGLALYDGELLGQPFRAVVKTFQVQVWRDLELQWQQLAPADQQQLLLMLPGAQHWFDRPAA